jgi:hypothetical protein
VAEIVRGDRLVHGCDYAPGGVDALQRVLSKDELLREWWPHDKEEAEEVAEEVAEDEEEEEEEEKAEEEAEEMVGGWMYQT